MPFQGWVLGVRLILGRTSWRPWRPRSRERPTLPRRNRETARKEPGASHGERRPTGRERRVHLAKIGRAEQRRDRVHSIGEPGTEPLQAWPATRPG